MNKTLLIIALFASVFFLIVYILKQRSNSNIPNKTFTIATITKKESKKNGVLYHYTFQSGGTFKGTFRHNSDKFSLGDRYFVSYNNYDPARNFLEIQHPVPDTITEVPENGWQKLP